MQIKATNSVIVGDPIIPIDHSKTTDKAHNIIVGDPINPNSPIKGLVDDTNTVIVGEPWSRFIKDNNSNNSGGAPAAVAKFNPGKASKPELTVKRLHEHLDSKLHSKSHKSRKHPHAEKPHFGISNLLHRKSDTASHQGVAAASKL